MYDESLTLFVIAEEDINSFLRNWTSLLIENLSNSKNVSDYVTDALVIMNGIAHITNVEMERWKNAAFNIIMERLEHVSKNCLKAHDPLVLIAMASLCGTLSCIDDVCFKQLRNVFNKICPDSFNKPNMEQLQREMKERNREAEIHAMSMDEYFIRDLEELTKEGKSTTQWAYSETMILKCALCANEMDKQHYFLKELVNVIDARG